MAVGVEAAVPPRPCPQAMVRSMARPVRHVRQAAGRYVKFTLLRYELVDNYLKEAWIKAKVVYLFNAGSLIQLCSSDVLR